MVLDWDFGRVAYLCGLAAKRGRFPWVLKLEAFSELLDRLFYCFFDKIRGDWAVVVFNYPPCVIEIVAPQYDKRKTQFTI